MYKLNEQIRELRLKLGELISEHTAAIKKGDFFKSLNVTEKMIWINEELNSKVQEMKKELISHS